MINYLGLKWLPKRTNFSLDCSAQERRNFKVTTLISRFWLGREIITFKATEVKFTDGWWLGTYWYQIQTYKQYTYKQIHFILQNEILNLIVSFFSQPDRVLRLQKKFLRFLVVLLFQLLPLVRRPDNVVVVAIGRIDFLDPSLLRVVQLFPKPIRYLALVQVRSWRFRRWSWFAFVLKTKFIILI